MTALPVFAWLTEGWRPTIPALWRAFAWFLLYYAVALVANAVTGSVIAASAAARLPSESSV